MADLLKTSTTDLSTVRRNWSISTRGPSAGLYRLCIVNTDLGDDILASLFSDDEPIEFVFDVNPKTIDLEEPAAVVIQPTQDGGQFIEHQGQIYKTITITGTTGLRPNKRAGDIIPVLNVPNPFLDLTQGGNGLPAGELSGFERLIQLRNLFRKYFDAKRNPSIAHKVELVWENGKEGEFYVVEPMVFRTRRDSGSPLTASYEMQLRTIRRGNARVAIDLDPRKTKFNNLIAPKRLVDFVRKLDQATAAAAALDARVVGKRLANVLIPARQLLQGLRNVVSRSSRVLDIPRASVKALAVAALELQDDLDTDLETDEYKTDGITTQLAQAKASYRKIFRVATSVHSEQSLFSQEVSSKYLERARAYRDPTVGDPITVGDRSAIVNAAAPVGTQLARVGNNDTIFSISLRLLGDSARWKELVVLNNLEAPYISSTGDGLRVLRPGDQILFPGVGSGRSGVAPSTDNDSNLVKRFGRDLKLVATQSAGGLTIYDLDISTRGDLARVEGEDNLVQAVTLKFATERGELPGHPNYGIRQPIGEKLKIRSLIGFNLDAQGTLLSDPRIENIRQLSFNAEGNTVNVRARVDAAGVDQAIEVGFAARR